MEAAVEVRSLMKRYGEIVAVNDVSFSIERGEIFGLLGPNGAGKTTTVEMIEGLRKPDSGSIRILGIDGSRDGRVKEIIGVQLQSTSIYDKITVAEAIDLFGGYYRKAIATPAVLEEVSLVDKKDGRVETLSGGQKQRLALALALVNDPDVLFLDEPTTGLDPQARRNVWDIIDRLRQRGKTIVLTTHYMEEAEQLCNRVGIMDHGKVIALDTPDNLIASAGLGSAVEFTCSSGDATQLIGKLNSTGKVAQEGYRYSIHAMNSFALLREIVHAAEEHNLCLEGFEIRKATLEDVFLALTGRRLRE